MTTNEELKKKIAEEYQTNIPLARKVLQNDLFKFNKAVMGVEKGKGNVPLAPVHKEICEFIDKNKEKKKLLLIPRGHLKSTVVTVSRCVQAIVTNPEVRILVANATYSNACSFLTEIKRHLKFNEKVHMFWGDLTKDSEKWSENQIMLSKKNTVGSKKEPTVTAMGVESALTSQHYDIIILDDLVNDKMVNTMDQINKTVNFYKECLNLLEPGGEAILVGTRWHDADLYGWILDKDNNVFQDFELFIREAFEGDLFSEDPSEPKLLFPKKHSKKHLQRLYEIQGPYIFSCQYLNNPIPSEDATFKRTWFQYYDPTELKGRLMNKFIMVDPAISQEKDADYTAIVTVGVDEFNLVYVLDVVRKRLNPNELINTIFDKYFLYSPAAIGIEDVAFQKSLQYSLTEEMHKRNVYLPLKPLRPGGRNKEMRIKGLQPLYANNRILHNKDMKNNNYLEDELLRFPKGKNDDVIDALAYMIDIPIFSPKRKKSSNRRGKRRYLYA